MRQRRPLNDFLGLLLVVALSPILVVALLCYLLTGLLLYFAIWCWWSPRGRSVLFVYSKSPIWQEYVEQNILPQLKDRAVILNWSDRRRWRVTLAVLAFRWFGGHRKFNPMGVVFRPFRLARTFRFYEPFRAYKRGHPEGVDKMADDMFAVIEGRSS